VSQTMETCPRAGGAPHFLQGTIFIQDSTIWKMWDRSEAILREGYAPGTIDAMRRHYGRYASFRSGIHRALGPEVVEDRILSMFVVHLLEEEGVSGQTVEQYLCILEHELELRNFKISSGTWRYLKKAAARKSRRVVRCPPMTLQKLREALKAPGLCISERIFLILMWMTILRPSCLKNQRVEDVATLTERTETLRLALWITQGEKQTSMFERGTPRCVRIMVDGAWGRDIRNYVASARRAQQHKLFPDVNQTRLNDILKGIKTDQQGQGLKDHYTLYSLRRGAIQHLAASKLSTAEIASLTGHRRQQALEAYIGSFLRPQAIQGELSSQYLLREVHVPAEVVEALEVVQLDEESNGFIEPTIEISEEPITEEKAPELPNQPKKTNLIPRALKGLLNPLGDGPSQGRRLRSNKN
jgi:hypothetical protein